MKLHRFTASNNRKAISMVHEALGMDALIYSTRSVPEGIEMVAGLPDEAEDYNEKIRTAPQYKPSVTSYADEALDKAMPDTRLIENLSTQLQMMQERFDHLSRQLGKKSQEGFYFSDDEYTSNRSALLHQLKKLGFHGKFCQNFINHYFEKRDIADAVTLENIKEDLRPYIQTIEAEIIDTKHVCALIGPTGIGKTTTILKLAKRYLAKYGPESLAIITTDYTDISGKNLLLHYKNLYNIDLEFADNPADLSLVIKSMHKKRLILVDTHGVSQRNMENVSKLRELMESQHTDLSTYLVLPCNVQESILDDIARVFSMTNLNGCILTKQDECITIASALSVCLNYAMKIAYICSGQNINTDIEKANPENILKQVMEKHVDDKTLMDKVSFQNTMQMATNLTEGRYER